MLGKVPGATRTKPEHTVCMATAPIIPISPKGYDLRPSELYVPLEEYLRTSYDPDMDYVDGHLEERNKGDPEHSDLQSAVLTFLRNHATAWNIRVLAECRVQVKENHFRIPDVLVLPRGEKPGRRKVEQPPLLCIEVLSPDDTVRRIMYRVDDYVEMGVKNVWIIDPEVNRVFTFTEGERRWSEDRILTVPGTAITLDLPAVKAEPAEE